MPENHRQNKIEQIMIIRLISRIVKKIPPLILVIVGYIIINLIFNYWLFWSDLIFDRSQIGSVWGEVQMYEWLTEKFYRQLITGQNPFGLTSGILYPFSIPLGLTDAANGLFFVFLRPLLSVHQSLNLIITIGQIFANIGMYLLLRKLKVKQIVAFLFGFSYAYMTFLTPRGGHLNYWCIYLFPWFYYCLLAQWQAKNKVNIMLASFGTALFFVLTLWLNFYYFIMLLTSIAFLTTYGILLEKPLLQRNLKKMVPRWCLTAIIIGILLLPWLTALYQVARFDSLPKTQGWAGAVEFSADLFGFLIPNGYSYYLSSFAHYLARHLPFARGIFENFTYPGLLIFFSYILLFFLKRKKQLTKKLQRLLIPLILVSISLWLLTLGPFLHIFGKWGFTVDDGITIVIPMPYLLLHYIPFLNNIRVPGRFVVIFIFFANIVGALVINYWISKKNKIYYYAIIIILFVITWIDQRYINSVIPPHQIYPYRIFNYIKNDPQPVSVLEIPFTARDGFTYFGDSNAINMSVGEMHHEKPVIGGYTGRISEYKNKYYQNNPLFGYLGRKIDTNLEHNPIIDKTQLPYWQELNIKAATDVVDFLDIKYVITKDDKPYLKTIRTDLISLEFNPVMKDVGFTLWARPVQPRDFVTIDLGQQDDDIYLGMGWGPPSDDGRWADKKSSVMLKLVKPKKMSLHFTAKGKSTNQEVNIYLNQRQITKLTINDQLHDYTVPLNDSLKSGLNEIHFFTSISASTLFNKIYLTEMSD